MKWTWDKSEREFRLETFYFSFGITNLILLGFPVNGYVIPATTPQIKIHIQRAVWGIVWIVLMSPFSGQNLCMLTEFGICPRVESCVTLLFTAVSAPRFHINAPFNDTSSNVTWTVSNPASRRIFNLFLRRFSFSSRFFSSFSAFSIC